ESTLSYLTDSLSRDPHQGADLLERHRVRPVLEAVVEVENFALAGRQVFAKDTIDELAHQMEVGDVFDLTTIDPGEALAQCACLAVGPIDRCIERDLGRRHLLGGTNRV